MIRKLERRWGGWALWGKDGTVSAELTPAILLSHPFLDINKTVALLEREVEEARVTGSLVVMASAKSGQDGEGFLFFSLTLLCTLGVNGPRFKQKQREKTMFINCCTVVCPLSGPQKAGLLIFTIFKMFSWLLI